MEELDIAAVVHRSIHGVFALVTRTFFISLINFIVNIFLTIFLSTTTFGIYGVVLAFISIFQYFSDIGLAGALIQKKEQLTQEDLKTTFTLQQMIIVSISIIALACSPIVKHIYHLQPDGLFLYQVLIISLFLSSLKTIPSILLERNLRFDGLVIPQVVETIIFDGIVLLLAIRGLGISSFTYAILARDVAGLITIYIISPWRIQLGLSKTVAKRLLSFGVPLQMNSILALIKDNLFFAILGVILPFNQVGFIVFAQKWANAPLRLVMDNVIRITFASFSRLQHDTKALSKAVEKSLFALGFLIFPSLVGLILLGPSFINIIPKYQKWEPALVSLTFFAIGAGLSAISTPLTNALMAIGKVKTTFYFMIFWTFATYILTLPFVFLFGFNGFAEASAIIALSVVMVVWITKKYINFALAPLIVPIIGTLLLGIFLLLITHFFVLNLLTIFATILVGALGYFAVCFLLAKEQLIQDILIIRKQFIH